MTTGHRALFLASVVALAGQAWLHARPQADGAPREAARSPHGDLAGECSTCHTAEGWRPLRDPLPFDHEGTGFVLRAAHVQAGCRDCHESLVFSHVGAACADCHADAHRGEMGPRCETCHAPESWTNRAAFFEVHSRTRFPLRGAHAGLDCESCHRGRQPREFVNTPVECVACHRADYEAAADPDHDALGFPLQCTQCHSAASAAWRGAGFGANFPHPATFPLEGAHARTSCAACHVGGRFAGTPRECIACHQDDFDRATNPNHRQLGFSTGCDTCHSFADWRPATFDHEPFFPIVSGRHAGIPCATCHPNAAAFRNFDCLSCHEHRRSEMDDEHDDVRGYRYESQACYSCHPRGVE